MILIVGVLFKQLTEGLESPQKPWIVVCLEFPSAIVSECKRICFVFNDSWNKRLSTSDNYINHSIPTICLIALEDLLLVVCDNVLNVLWDGTLDDIPNFTGRNDELRRRRSWLEMLRQRPEERGRADSLAQGRGGQANKQQYGLCSDRKA